MTVVSASQMRKGLGGISELVDGFREAQSSCAHHGHTVSPPHAACRAC